VEQQSSLLLLVVVTQDVVMKDVDYRFFGWIDHQHLIVPDGIFILIGDSYLHPNIFWRPHKFSFRQRRSDIDLRVCLCVPRTSSASICRRRSPNVSAR